jgi:hypothetical protein
MAVDGYLERTVLSLRGPSFKYIFGSILLFHSFLPGALALQTSFWIHQIYCLIRPGPASRRSLAFIRFATAFSISALFTLPWAIWLKIGGQNLNFDLEIIKQNLHWHYIYIHKYIFPFFLFIPILLSMLQKSFRVPMKSGRENLNDKTNFATIPLLFLLIIITNLSLYTVNHPYFFRYLIPLIPFFAFIAAKIIISLPKKLAIAAIFITFFPNFKLLSNYVFEITHPYIGANEQIITMLNSKQFYGIKSLAINYDDFTFRFHTNFVVHGAQELPVLNVCPDTVIIFPEWGNEELLREIANRCGLEKNPSQIHYAKLADDPSPVYHRFVPPQTGSVKIFVNTRLL